MECPNCKHNNPPGAKFCENCGLNLEKTQKNKRRRSRSLKYTTLSIVLVLVVILLAPIVEREIFLLVANKKSDTDYRWAQKIMDGGTIEYNNFIGTITYEIGINKRAKNSKLKNWLINYEKERLKLLIKKGRYNDAKNFNYRFVGKSDVKSIIKPYEKRKIEGFLSDVQLDYKSARSFLKQTKYLSGQEAVSLFRDFETSYFSSLKAKYIDVKLTSKYEHGKSYVPESHYIQEHDYLFMDTYYTLETNGGYYESYVSGTTNHLVVTNKFIAITIEGEVAFSGQRDETSLGRSLNSLFSFGLIDHEETITEVFSFENIVVKPHEVKHFDKRVGLESEVLFHTKSANLRNVRIKNKYFWIK